MADKKKNVKKQKLRNAEYYDMQEIFDGLYEKSRAGKIFTNLVDIMKSPENIKLAYRNMRKNMWKQNSRSRQENNKRFE